MLRVVFLAVLLWGASFATADANDTPNVIVLALDTVRADHLGCYGNGTVRTPNLDALARESILFENAYATAPWTLPSFTSFMTGRYPYHHGVVGGDRTRLDDGIPTLGELLAGQGYASKAFVAVSWLNQNLGATRGIEDISQNMVGHVSSRLLQYRPRVLRWIEHAPRKPYFLFVHYFDVHAPYLPPEPWTGMYYEGDPSDSNETSLQIIYSDQNRVHWNKDPHNLYRWLARYTDLRYPVSNYGAGVTYLDHYLGEVLDLLRTTGELDDSILVVMSDHGEHLLEHDMYFTHGLPYQETLHVPLLIRLPEGEHGGRRVSDEVSLVDVLPTLLELLRVPQPEGLDGISLRPALWGESLASRWLRAEQGSAPDNLAKALWDDGHRLVTIVRPDRTLVELYDRRADRAETRDISAAQPDVRERMLELLWDAYDRENPVAAVGTGDHPLDPEVRERLRSLGYLDR
jgi:arylsulfatase A-like enzyme